MLKACLWVCAASAVWACGDGQAEDGYRGEPLFSAHGNVVLSDLDRTPALTLGLRFEQRMPADHSMVQHLIKFEVVGSFPNAFTMRIYEPPPPEVVVALVPGEPAFAEGALVTVRPDHPDWLRQETFGNIHGGPFVIHTCAKDGECHDFDLNPPPCGFRADLPLCRDEDTWATYYPSAGDYEYRFVYFAEAAPAGSVTSRYFAGGQPISKGYHLLMDILNLPESETTEADNACILRAQQRATAAVNMRHGGEPGAPTDPMFDVELRAEHIIAMVAEGCSQPYVRWVDDPNAVSLVVSLSVQKSTL